MAWSLMNADCPVNSSFSISDNLFMNSEREFDLLENDLALVDLESLF